MERERETETGKGLGSFTNVEKFEKCGGDWNCTIEPVEKTSVCIFVQIALYKWIGPDDMRNL